VKLLALAGNAGAAGHVPDRVTREEVRNAVLAPVDLLTKLHAIDVADKVGGGETSLLAEWQGSGVRFAASSERMEDRYWQAVRELFTCIKPAGGSEPILHEGGIYLGCWLESTGTINAELLSRFLPSVAGRTFAAFAEGQRADGLIPYKLTANGPAFSQIQLVTPLARCVWNHYLQNGRDKGWLAPLYAAMSRYDDWLATWRDSRGTGAVEAFCAYDTGHDLSPRFWHVPDSPYRNDPTRSDPASPILPFIAPDLTANVACQRRYLARIAEELGEDGARWREAAASSEKALFEQCWDEADRIFYDRDRNGELVRVQSDVLLRVLASEIGDADFFAAALRRYLLNMRKFFAKYPFTSIALDDPRYDPNYDYNSWAGPSNFLSLIRAPHAFEHHGRHVELTWAMQPTLSALFKGERFPQTLHPHTGREGFTASYSPAILCLLDFIERLSGILPRPEGTLWFTCLVPAQIEHRDEQHETAYARKVDGHDFELVNRFEGSAAYRDGELLFEAPRGLRVVTDRTGAIRSLIGMSAGGTLGRLRTPAGETTVALSANEQLDFTDGTFRRVRAPGLVPPSY